MAADGDSEAWPMLEMVVVPLGVSKPTAEPDPFRTRSLERALCVLGLADIVVVVDPPVLEVD